MKITVSESIWGQTFLLEPTTGKMCCLGQAAEQCGTPRDHIRGRTMMPADELNLDPRMQMTAPHEVLRSVNDLTEGAGNASLWLLKNCIGYLNDHYHRARDDAKRSALKGALVAAFKEAGYELGFAK